MDTGAGLEYVRENSRAVMLTTRSGGRPAMAPITPAVIDDVVEHPDWADYRRAHAGDKRCVVRFEILSAGPDVSG